MKKIIILLFCFLASNICFAEISEKVLNETMNFRKSLYCASNETKILELLNFYENKINSYTSEEEKLFSRNVYLLEKSNFLQTEENKKEFYYEFFRQNDLNLELIDKKNCSSDFYAISADLISRLVSFSSGGEQIKLSSKAKELYKKAKKIDKNNFNASIGYGLWLYFAPSIAGGGFDSSIKELSKAIKYAKSDFEKYIAQIYRSQVFYKLGKIEKYNKDLQMAKNVMPDECVINFIIERNKNGKLFFE